MALKIEPNTPSDYILDTQNYYLHSLRCRGQHQLNFSCTIMAAVRRCILKREICWILEVCVYNCCYFMNMNTFCGVRDKAQGASTFSVILVQVFFEMQLKNTYKKKLRDKILKRLQHPHSPLTLCPVT